MRLPNELNAWVEPTSMSLIRGGGGGGGGGHQLDTVGKCFLDRKVNEIKDSTPYVIRDNVRPLLGLESCLELELIALNNSLEQIGLSGDEVQQTSNHWMNFWMFLKV